MPNSWDFARLMVRIMVSTLVLVLRRYLKYSQHRMHFTLEFDAVLQLARYVQAIKFLIIALSGPNDNW